MVVTWLVWQMYMRELLLTAMHTFRGSYVKYAVYRVLAWCWLVSSLSYAKAHPVIIIWVTAWCCAQIQTCRKSTVVISVCHYGLYLGFELPFCSNVPSSAFFQWRNKHTKIPMPYIVVCLACRFLLVDKISIQWPECSYIMLVTTTNGQIYMYF